MMVDLDVEALKRRKVDMASAGVPMMLNGPQVDKLIAALEDRERLQTACQQALEAIASCVVGWDYPDVPPMPAWAKRLESVVPMLQGALGIRSALERRDG